MFINFQISKSTQVSLVRVSFIILTLIYVSSLLNEVFIDKIQSNREWFSGLIKSIFLYISHVINPEYLSKRGEK